MPVPRLIMAIAAVLLVGGLLAPAAAASTSVAAAAAATAAASTPVADDGEAETFPPPAIATIPPAAAAEPEQKPAAAPMAPEPAAPAAPEAEERVVDEGDEVLLACAPPAPVDQCQWGWRALDAPTAASPLVIKQFQAFGPQAADCSVRFTSALPEQQGEWSCSARSGPEEPYRPHALIRLVVRSLVHFEPVTERVEVRAGEPATLPCHTTAPAAECRWRWAADPGAPADVPELTPAEVTLAPGGGDRRDCSLRLEAARPEHGGMWTCEARAPAAAAFTAAAPVRFNVLKGVTFVELSQDIQVNAGEPVALRCVVSMHVDACRWLWRPLGEPDTAAVTVKGFAPAASAFRDCSVRFPAVLEEQQGLWSCAVRAAPDAPFVEAPPATLTLLPPIKLRFLETPGDKRVALGHATVLPCVATSAVTDCLWTWHPPNDPEGEGIQVKQFPAFGNYSRDCSLNFTSVHKKQEGYWGCTIRLGSSESPMKAESPAAKLTTFESEPIEFTELSQDIHVPNGSHLLLRCVSSSELEECQWSWNARNGTKGSQKIIKSFPAHGNGSHDCSVHINSAAEEHEGIWVCGARKEGETRITWSQDITRVTLIRPESVMVAIWAAPGEKVTLACRLSSLQPSATCHWQHPHHVIVSERNRTQRHFVQQNNVSGVCTLLLDPQPEDLGQWRCVFTMPMKNEEYELAAATLILLTTNSVTDKTMDWIVGVLAGLVLLLTILIIIILVCKRKTTGNKPKEGLGNPALQADNEKKTPSRYTEAPSKINFQFGEAPLAAGSTLNQQSGESHHIYEPVDRYLSPSTNKSIYENVK